MLKALSPLVSVVILVVISISIASLVAPWMYELVTTTTNETSTSAQQQIKCRSAGMDFDSEYGQYGVDWNFTGNESDWLEAKVVNTKNINLYGFSFEVTLESQSGEEIKHYDCTSGTEMSESNPLMPGRSAILEANITEDINDSVSTLKAVKVLNPVCPEISPSLIL